MISSERLLQVAREVFLELGIRATTAAVAERAGIAEGTIFHRFKSKEELFHAAMNVDPDTVLSLVEALRARAGIGDLRATLIEFAERFMDFGRTAMPVMMMSWSNPESQLCQERTSERGSRYRRVIGALTTFFEIEMAGGRLRSADPEVMSRMLLGSLHHFCMIELFAGTPGSAPVLRRVWSEGRRHSAGVLRCRGRGETLEPPRGRSRHVRKRLNYALKTGLWLALGARPALATQPLDTFLEHAKTQSFDTREADATEHQRAAEADSALGRLTPAISARGVYSRNQEEVAVQLPGTTEKLTISPLNQLDAYLQLDIPLIDLASYHRYKAAGAVAESAKEQRGATTIDVSRSVTRAYYQLQGAGSLVSAAQEGVKAAQVNLKYVDDRHSSGAATDLDHARATASVARAERDLADAELATALAARSLETLSGLSPTPPEPLPDDDLHGEGNLSSWLALSVQTPQQRAAQKLGEAAEAKSQGRSARALAHPGGVGARASQQRQRLQRAQHQLHAAARAQLAARLHCHRHSRCAAGCARRAAYPRGAQSSLARRCRVRGLQACRVGPDQEPLGAFPGRRCHTALPSCP